MHFHGACFSQGFAEFDYCTAKCLMTTFDFKFDCGKMNKETCTHQCKIRDCEENCATPEVKGGICSSNGLLYPSECAMKCRAPSATIRWKCKSPFSFKGCGNKCAHAREAELGYHNHDHAHTHEEVVVVKRPALMLVGSTKD